MTGYILLQSFAKITINKDLSESFNMYRRFLDDIGYINEDIEQWISSFSWESLIDFGFASMHTWNSIDVDGKMYNVAPSVVGFSGNSDIDIPWIEFNLLFEPHAITYSPHDWKYRPDAGRDIWKIMRLLFAIFKQSGVYLTDEVNDSQTWYAISGIDGKLWSFDLAIVPKSFSAYFSNLPSDYERFDVNADIAFIRSDAWITYPWDNTGAR